MSAVAWHDLECGAYAADLPVWRELAAEAAGAVVEIGAGTGRVALDLAHRGTPVVAVDRDGELLEALRARTGRLPVEIVEADARRLDLGRRFDLIIVPMQTIQLLGGRAGRSVFLARAAAHLHRGGRLAAAIADPLEAYAEADAIVPPPDVGRDGELALSSRPARVLDGPAGWTIERVREAVAPDGRRVEELDRIVLERVSPDELEAEGGAAGLRPAGRRRIAATDEHVGSEVVLLSRG